MTATAPTIEIGRARPQDDPAIRYLLSRPMPGPVAFAARRDPDYRLAAGIEGDRHSEVVVRDHRDGRVVAFGSRAVGSVWINGRATRVGYLGGLRVDPGYPMVRRVLQAGFDLADRDRRNDEADFDITSILADNVRARRLLERGLRGLPTYTPIGQLVTLVLRVPRRPAGRVPSRAAEVADLDGLGRLLREDGRRWQCRPAWSEDDLVSAARCRDLALEDFVTIRNGDRIRSCAALWDQRAFKQIVVEHYARWLGCLRLPANAVSRLWGGPALPRPGLPLGLGYLSHVVVDPEHHEDFEALLQAAFVNARRRRLTHLAVGLPAAHPLAGLVRRRHRPWVCRSTFYTVSRGRPPRLEDNGVWPEVATL